MALLRMLCITVVRAWDTWRVGLQDPSNEQEKVAFATAQLRKLTLAKVWATWVARVHGSANRLNKFTSFLSRYFTLPLLAKYFAQWFRHIEEQRQIKASISFLLSSKC